MEDSKTLIILRLEGPFQSWGDHSKWDDRDSGMFPTKSGIVGLIACAMGLRRGDAALVDLSKNIRIAVRADRAGTYALDYQTVQGRPRLATAENGLRAADMSNIVSPRWYLEDASFLVAVEAPERLIGPIEAALKAPKWPIYLGRKSCVPSRPVFERTTEEYSSLMDALERYPLAQRSDAGSCLRYECEDVTQGVACYTRSDELTAPNREFALRQIYTGTVRKEIGHVSDKDRS